MTAQEVLSELKSLGRESYKSVLLSHGVEEPVFGASIAEMKKIVKRVKKNHQLALDLYATGVYDAMYLAGLLADDAKMTPKDLNRWAKQAYCAALSDFTVAWVTAESGHGLELALEWIDSKKERIAAAGWATLSSLASITADADLDLELYERLLRRVKTTIHEQPNGVRYVMNSFIIAVGSYVKPLSNAAQQAARQIGRVSVDMGDTSCNVPYAPDYIAKVKARGAIGKKRKSAKC